MTPKYKIGDRITWQKHPDNYAIITKITEYEDYHYDVYNSNGVLMVRDYSFSIRNLEHHTKLDPICLTKLWNILK